jgi:putative Mg2+ transporter-C (MgtC) family protein
VPFATTEGDPAMIIPLAELLPRLLVAALLGALIGLEREAAARGAGARTHALVALGAALFTVAGAYGFADAGAAARDPARIAAQVATGVGFIGAGAVIRNGSSVLGVTTAATVWLSAGVGVAAAAGGLVPAALATAVTLSVLVLLRTARPLMRRIGRNRALLELEYERGHGTLGPLLQTLEELEARIDHIQLEDDDQAHRRGVRHVTIQVSIPRGVHLEALVAMFTSRPEVHRVRVAEGEAA